MTAKNDITGDKIKSRLQSAAYATGWDRVFGAKIPQSEISPETALEASKSDSDPS